MRSGLWTSLPKIRLKTKSVLGSANTGRMKTSYRKTGAGVSGGRTPPPRRSSLPSTPRGPQGSRQPHRPHRRQNSPVEVGPELRAVVRRPVVELAVGAVVPRHRLPEVVGAVGVREAVVLLGVVAVAGQLVVGGAGGHLVAHHRIDCRPADLDLPPPPVGRVDDCPRRHLGLEDR